MKNISRMIILLLFLSGVVTISSNMLQSPLTRENTLIETQLFDSVEKSLSMNIIDRPIRVAIYFEANTSVPAYSSVPVDGLTNDYDEVQTLLEGAGYTVALVSTTDILNHQLITANYDVFVLINHLPRENIANLVKDFWLGGGGVLSFNFGLSFLFYYGMWIPELSGSDYQGPYWQNLPAEDMNVTVRHPITQEHQIGDAVYERAGDWVTFWGPVWESYSSIEQGVELLLSNFTTVTYCYGAAIDSSYRGGRIVQLPGDGTSIPADFEGMIINAAEWLVPKPKGRIAYDLSHQPRLCVDAWDIDYSTVYFAENSFSQLRDLYVNHSYTFDKLYPSASGNFTATRLAEYDILIINWPDLNFTASEKTVIEEWIKSGGSLLVLGDRAGLTGPNRGDLQINYLLDDFGMELSDDDIMDYTTTTNTGDHPTLEGCFSLSISYRNYISITNPVAKVLWDDAGEPIVAAQEYGDGRVVLFSDMNILDNGRVQDYGNRIFAVNVANWLSATQTNVLLYTSGYGYNYYRTPVANALNELGLNFYLTFVDEYFEEILITKDWDLVVIDEANHDISSAYSTTSDYIDTMTGRLLISSWNMDWTADHPFWTKLGVLFAEEWDNNQPAYIWDSSHPIFNSPIDYQALILNPSGLYFDDGDKVHILDDAISLAGFSTGESENNSAIVLSSDGRTLLNSFMITGLLDDFDDSTYQDAYELWLNEIAFMMRPILDSPADIEYIKGSKGNNISWTPYSWAPSQYSVDINGTIITSEAWDGNTILVDVDGLAVGIHLVTLTVGDELGFSGTDTVMVNVTANPDIFAFLQDLDPELLIIIGGGIIGLILVIVVVRRISGRGSKK